MLKHFERKVNTHIRHFFASSLDEPDEYDKMFFVIISNMIDQIFILSGFEAVRT